MEPTEAQLAMIAAMNAEFDAWKEWQKAKEIADKAREEYRKAYLNA